MRVGVVGAYGRMGSAICEAIDESEDLYLVARIGRGDYLSVLAEEEAEVIVDVTHVDSARHNLAWAALHGMHAVVGTTGFTADDVDNFDKEFKSVNKSCFLVPNFSIGAILMMEFAAKSAKYFDAVEIVEMHHNKKKDAPSGTSALTAKKIAAAREIPWVPEATEQQNAEGVRGGSVDGIPIHSVRLPGLLAHQEVIFGSQGQTFTLRHDSFNAAAFMPGMIKSVQSVSSLPVGITTGLEAVLDFD